MRKSAYLLPLLLGVSDCGGVQSTEKAIVIPSECTNNPGCDNAPEPLRETPLVNRDDIRDKLFVALKDFGSLVVQFRALKKENYDRYWYCRFGKFATASMNSIESVVDGSDRERFPKEIDLSQCETQYGYYTAQRADCFFSTTVEFLMKEDPNRLFVMVTDRNKDLRASVQCMQLAESRVDFNAVIDARDHDPNSIVNTLPLPVWGGGNWGGGGSGGSSSTSSSGGSL